MDAFRSKPVKLAAAAFYIVLMFLAFCSDSYRLPVAVRYAVNMVVFGCACAAFLIRPDFNMAKFCVRLFMLFSVPYLVFWLWSAGIWISEFQSFTYIMRGSLNVFYMFTNLLLVSSAVYLFNKKAIFYTAVSMAMTNTLIFLQVGARFGFPRLIAEYLRLLVTFADDTGGAVKQMEIHGLVFGWGVFIVYYLMNKSKNEKKDWIMLCISAFYFTIALKRISVPAVLGAAMLYHIMIKCKPHHLRMISNMMAVVIGVGAFSYLAIIKSGLFFEIAEKYEINLMYRDVLYNYYRNYYELSPTFLGNGIRFIYAHGNFDPTYTLGTDAVHNVYLEFYVEVGFWCWWFWIFYELAFRVHRIAERYSIGPAVATICLNIYVFFTYLTDNTSFYYCINILYRMVIMVFCYENMIKDGICDSEGMSIEQLDFARKQEKWGR